MAGTSEMDFNKSWMTFSTNLFVPLPSLPEPTRQALLKEMNECFDSITNKYKQAFQALQPNLPASNPLSKAQKSRIAAASREEDQKAPPEVAKPSAATAAKLAALAGSLGGSGDEVATSEHGIGSKPSVRVHAPPGGKTSIQIGVPDDDKRVEYESSTGPEAVGFAERKKLSDLITSKGKLKETFNKFSVGASNITIKQFQVGLSGMGFELSMDQVKWLINRASGGQDVLSFNSFVKVTNPN